MKSMLIRVVLLSTAGLFASFAAHAAYPDKAVKYIIPFAPGGESDIAARFSRSCSRKNSIRNWLSNPSPVRVGHWRGHKPILFPATVTLG